MTAHPTSLELARFLDGEGADTTRNHIADCAYCRSLVAGAADALPLPDPGKVWSGVTFDVPAPSIGMPARGDVWRVVWNDIHQLAVVLSESDEVLVAPVLPDPNAADEWTVLLGSSDSGIGVDLAVAVAHRFTLPLFVFDACVGHLTETGLKTVISVSQDYRDAVPASGPVGPPVFSVLDGRVEAIESLADEFVALAEASWYRRPESVETDWSALLRSGVMETRRVYEVSGGAQLTQEEAAAAAELGIPVGQAALDEGLVAFLDRPEHSAQLRRSASARSVSEAQIRAVAAEQMTNRRLALAARGGDGSFDWAPLFREFLDEA